MNTPTHTPPASPGVGRLVRTHLRLLVREFPVAWIAAVGLFMFVSVLAVRAAIHVNAGDPESLAAALAWARGIPTAFAFLLLFISVYWPDAVWRNLPPGGRETLDALPVDLRTHRLARIAAGAVLPLIVLVATATIPLAVRLAVGLGSGVAGPGQDGGLLAAGLAGGDPLGAGAMEWAAAIGGLVMAYLAGSILALRLGRVLVPFLLIWGLAGALLYFFLLVLEWEWGTEMIRIGIFEGTWSPGQALQAGVIGSSGRPLPSWTWAAIMLGLCGLEAGRRG